MRATILLDKNIHKKKSGKVPEIFRMQPIVAM